jgi:phospho-2-dehydro-3-deoxyheptonate aldolase
MTMRMNHELPSPEVLKAQYPLSEEIKRIKQERDAEIRDIFAGKSDKFLVVVGPCSADNEESVCEYMRRLKKVADDAEYEYKKVEDSSVDKTPKKKAWDDAVKILKEYLASSEYINAKAELEEELLEVQKVLDEKNKILAEK